MLYLIFLILVMVVLGTMVWAGFSAAPFVPTFKKGLKAGVRLAAIGPGEKVCDLGCGDGRWLLETAQSTSAGKIVGFEISLIPLFIAWLRILFSPARFRISLRYQSFYRANLSEFDVVFGFLIPRIMPRVEKLLLKNLKPGARFVSYVFKLPNLEPEKIIKTSPTSPSIYLYRF